MYADYHIHTEFSDDSREPMENQIERAIELGLEEICFTDHVDYGIKKDWEEGNIEWRGGDGMSYDVSKMDPLANVNYQEYFGKLLRMKETYKGRIRIRQGLEFGIQSGTIPQYERLWGDTGNSWILPCCPYTRWTTRNSGHRSFRAAKHRRSTT